MEQEPGNSAAAEKTEDAVGQEAKALVLNLSAEELEKLSADFRTHLDAALADVRAEIGSLVASHIEPLREEIEKLKAMPAGIGAVTALHERLAALEGRLKHML